MSELAERLRKLLKPQEDNEGKSFMERESAAQIEGSFEYLERGSGEREAVLAAVEDLERSLEPPKIALRRAGTADDTHLDDVVVTAVTMFRAEILDEATLWVCCYLSNAERITWEVHGEGLEYEVVEMPESYEPFDQEKKPE